MELASTDYDLLSRYWAEEPWGPYRDNLHAAIIATEVRRTLTPKADIPLDKFMIAHPKRRAGAKKQALIASLRSMAGVPKTAEEVAKRKKAKKSKARRD